MLRNFKNLHGCHLSALDGEIGRIREVLFEDNTWKVRYFLVTTGSWLLGREVLIAPWVIEGIDEASRLIAVNLNREEVRNSPPVTSDQPVSRQYEESMFKYYGWDPYWSVAESGVGFGMPVVAYPGALPPETIAGPPKKITTHLRSSGEILGYRIHATDRELGNIDDLVLDDVSWAVRYAVVRPGSWWTQSHVLLAPEWITRISYENSEASVDLPAGSIENAPRYDGSTIITRAYEDQLHEHYNRQAYWLPEN